MKLDRISLRDLRRGLRNHPRSAQEVAGLDLEGMRGGELVALATRLGLDSKSLINGVREEDTERQVYSACFPAFRGTLDFSISIYLFGKRVTRKARADYTFTPEWEYFDTRKRAPYVGWPGSSACITVRTVPDKDGTDGGSPWRKVNILDIWEVWDILDDAIEERCRAEDAKRRQAAARGRRGKNGGSAG